MEPAELFAYPYVRARAFYPVPAAVTLPPPPHGPLPPPPPMRRQLTIAGPYTCPFAGCRYVPEHKETDAPCEGCGRHFHRARRVAHDAAFAAARRLGGRT